jgi:hypothetical protein
MGRRDYQYDKVLCVKGIDQQEGLADPVLTCADARNVWAPDGKLESRPGYQGICAEGYVVSTTTGSDATIIREDIPSAFQDPVAGVLDLSGLAVGERWYVGFPAPRNSFLPYVTTANTTSGYVNAEYWDGTTWRWLRVTEEAVDLTTSKLQPWSTHLAFTGVFSPSFKWASPNDWASTTVNGHTAYFLRFTVAGGNLSAGTAVHEPAVAFPWYILDNEPNARWKGMFGPDFPSTSRTLLYMYLPDESPTGLIFNRSGVIAGDTTAEQLPVGDDNPATIAVIPQFEEVYVAYNYQVTVHKAYPTVNDDYYARVEDDPAFIGPTADYAPDLVPQLATFPRAKYIEFFKGQLWAANFLDDPFSIRWSAPQPAYRVWPTLNIETLMENDNSPIIGIKGFQSHMTVFKNDSVWRMVDTGISEFALQSYAAERVVNGVGCVSQSSIAEVMNRLVFLAEDGIYTYDGTSAVEKLSMRISKTVASITPGRRPFATGVNWKSKNLYLLSVSVNGSDANNLVIVWDYKNDAFWLWDDIEAQVWLLDEDSADNEKLYFGDSKGRIYEMGVGLTDHGGTIDSWFVTQRQQEDHWTRRLRSVEVYTSNDTRQLSLTVIPNDTPVDLLSAVTLDMTDDTEEDWNTLVYGTDKWVAPRGRMRKSAQNKAAEWFQLKLQHNTKNVPMIIEHIQMGYVPLGRR